MPVLGGTLSFAGTYGKTDRRPRGSYVTDAPARCTDTE